MAKQLKKVYLSPDVLELLDAERRRTNYSRNIIIEMLVRKHLARNEVEEAVAATPATRAARTHKRRIDLGI